MPTSVGPNTYGEENLVFGYDLGDVINSYKGEPTTNLATLDLSSTKWYSEGGTKVLQSETLDGYPVYQFRSSGSLIYVSPVAFNQLTATSNDVTLSAYFKNIGTSTQTVNVFLANDFSTDSNGDPNSRSIPADSKWYRQSWTRYAAANTYNQVEFRTFSDTLLISKPQVEYKKHATPPVEGTRSATQGLQDLTGNSTIDLTNVSFDSNAQMTFDGTNDYASLGSPSVLDLGSMTQEAVYQPLAINRRNPIIGDNNPTGSDSSHAMWLEHYDNNKLILVFGDGTTYGDVFSTATITDTTKYHHVVCVRDASAKTVEYFINGVSDGVKDWANKSTIGAPVVYDGVFHGTQYEHWIGGSLFSKSYSNIPYVKIYNRALTASEVKSNYNAIKGRFNI